MTFRQADRQIVRVNASYSTSAVLNTGAPQGCCLGPILDRPFTVRVCSKKFPDDVAVIGLISDNNEVACLGISEREYGSNTVLSTQRG